jgi:hypothetical protein
MTNENKLNVFNYPFYEIIHESLQEFSQIANKNTFDEIFKNAKTSQITFYRNNIPLIFYGKSH